MVKGRGQKASEEPRNISQALSQLRGLVRQRPYDLGRMARLVHQFAPSRQVLLDDIDDVIVDDFMVNLLQREPRHGCERLRSERQAQTQALEDPESIRDGDGDEHLWRIVTPPVRLLTSHPLPGAVAFIPLNGSSNPL